MPRPQKLSRKVGYTRILETTLCQYLTNNGGCNVLSTFTIYGVELSIPLPLTQSIFSSTQKLAAQPQRQTAASMLRVTVIKYSTLCKPVDALLGGGLKSGSILEISGPPGSRKEALVVNLTRSFVEAQEGVIFVGALYPLVIRRVSTS